MGKKIAPDMGLVKKLTNKYEAQFDNMVIHWIKEMSTAKVSSGNIANVIVNIMTNSSVRHFVAAVEGMGYSTAQIKATGGKVFADTLEWLLNESASADKELDGTKLMEESNVEKS